MTIDFPVSIEGCRLAGRRFGSAWRKSPRLAFEKALVVELTALREQLREQDREEALAAFDQAAWVGWEAGRLLTNKSKAF